MAYTSDQLPNGLEENTTLADGDEMVAGDADDSNRAKKITFSNLMTQIGSYTLTLTNKTINAANNTISNISTAMLASPTGSDTNVVTGTAGTSGDIVIWDANGDAVDGPTPPSGTIVGTTDTQTLTNKTLTDATNSFRAATTTVDGTQENATGAETTTGTATDRTVTPSSLASSDFGIRYMQAVVFGFSTDISTGDGKFYFHIPAGVGGMNLVEVHAECITAATGTGTETIDIQIANVTQAADMLSTKLTIDEDETGSDTAATAAVIDGTNDDVAENDVIRIDIDAVPTTTPGTGLIVTMGFQLP